MKAGKRVSRVRALGRGVFQVKLTSDELNKVTASARRRGVTPLEVFDEAVTRAMKGSYSGLMLANPRLEKKLKQLFRKFRGNVSAVARSMNKERTQIRRWMRRYRLTKEQFQPYILAFGRRRPRRG